MPKITIPYLLDEKLIIHNREIRCKVVGSQGTENDNNPYILIIPGGPGFGLDMYKYFVHDLLVMANQEKRSFPHFILYDPLGCGNSDNAVNPNMEYTVDHFTEMDATLVEIIKQQLNINKMNLIIATRSFGHMVAINFPLHRPQWLNPASDIHLQSILSIVGANGARNKDYARQFLKEHYQNLSTYQEMALAEEKLFAGEIQNSEDYIKNFIVPMTPAYSP